MLLSDIQAEFVKGGIGVALRNRTRAVHACRGGMLQDRARFEAEIDHVLRTLHVGALKVLIVARMIDVCGGMNDHIHLLCQMQIRLFLQTQHGLRDITDLDLIGKVFVLCGEIVFQNVLELFLVAHKADDVHLAAQQLTQNMRAKISGRTRQQYVLDILRIRQIGIVADELVDVDTVLLFGFLILFVKQHLLKHLRGGIVIDHLRGNTDQRTDLQSGKAVAAVIKEIVADAHILAAQDLFKRCYDLDLLGRGGIDVLHRLFADRFLDHGKRFLTLDLQRGGLGKISCNKIVRHDTLIRSSIVIILLDAVLDLLDHVAVIDIRGLKSSTKLTLALVYHNVLDARDHAEIRLDLLGVNVFAVI